MAGRRLRYSERKAISEAGALGDLRDEVSPDLRNAVALYLHYQGQRVQTEVRASFDSSVADQLGRHFGNANLSQALARPSTDDFLDVIEIVCEQAVRRRPYSRFRRGSYLTEHQPFSANIEQDVNDLFDRHRLGYRIENGAVVPISSPLLDVEVVGPALLAVTRPGWDQVQRSFLEALDHQRRSDEHGEALTAANAAVEAALKAAGYSGATLGDLAKSFRNAPVAAGYSPQVVQTLVQLLQQLIAWRSHSGSAHGKAPEAGEPPPELVALAIHWAGAFIAYLAASHQE